MSKPMLVTLPFVLLLLDWWPLQRITFHVSRFTSVRVLLEKLPFILLSLLSCIVTFLVQKKGGAVSVALPFSARAANAVVACARYLRKTIWPDDLSVLYPHPGNWPIGVIIAASLLLVVITIAAAVYARKLPFIAVGWFWFLGMLVPVIGLVQVGIQSMADRYMYLPLIGLSVVLVWGAGMLLERSQKLLPPLSLVGAFVLIGCIAVTRFQVGIWKNTETLFRRAVTVTKSNYLAYNNLGYYLSKNGRMPEAMENYRASLKINPNYEDANNNLGKALADQRKYAEAIELYRTALRTAPNNVEVHNNLANALSESGNLDEALAHYRFVLDKNPKHVNALNGIGSVLAMKGQLDEGMTYFNQVLQLSPDDSSVHGNLGNAYAVKRDFQKAMEQYKEALRLSPSDHQTMNNLGNVLTELGRLDEAVTNYLGALKIRADNPEAHFNLGYALLRLGRREDARKHFEEALKYNPNYPEARRQLDALNAAK
jgi:tetratricopeptide (TPR) repeat protein